jgi:thioredoxin 1
MEAMECLKSIVNLENAKSNMKEFNEIINQSKPTLVDFFASWCGACQRQAPIIEQVKESLGDKATVIKIDIDKEPELAAHHKVQSIPTLVLYKNGRSVWRATGVQQADAIEQRIRDHIGCHCR